MMRRLSALAIVIAAAVGLPSVSVAESGSPSDSAAAPPQAHHYIGSKKSHRLHTENCVYVRKIDKEYRVKFYSLEAAKKEGYYPCVVCRPGTVHIPDVTMFPSRPLAGRPTPRSMGLPGIKGVPVVRPNDKEMKKSQKKDMIPRGPND